MGYKLCRVIMVWIEGHAFGTGNFSPSKQNLLLSYVRET